MKIGMKIVYVVLFLSIYIFLIGSMEPHESYSIFFIILFIPTALVAIPQLFKDAVVPFFNTSKIYFKKVVIKRLLDRSHSRHTSVTLNKEI